MRSLTYDIIGIGLILGSLWFLYRAVEFLAQKDYVAGLLAFGIGFVVVRAGVEVGRLAMVDRERED